MTEIELKPEHVEDPNTRRVGILIGVVGILLAVVTIASHRAHTGAVIFRTKANDQWSYYQAKKIREATTDIAVTLLQTLPSDPAKVGDAVGKLEAARQKYQNDEKDIEEKAHVMDESSELEEKRALRFDFGEGLLELGLVLCSLYFLARKSFFPIFGLLASIAGTALGIAGFLL
jgi:hypothetical protein